MKSALKYIKNPLIRNMAVYAFSDGITKAMPFLIFPIVAYYLTAEEFGIVTNYQVLIGIIAPLVGLSATSYFSVEYYRKGENIKATYNNILYFNFILLFIVSILVTLLIDYFKEWTGLSEKWIYLALVSKLFLICTDLFLSRLRMEEKAKLFGVFNISTSALNALLTLLFVVAFKMAWEGRIISLFLTTTISGIAAIYFTIGFIGNLHKPDFRQMKSFLSFGLPLLPHNLSIWLRTGFEKLFITGSLGLASNGIYSFAITISTIFAMFSNAYFSAFSPYVYKSLAMAESVGEQHLYKVKLSIVKKSYIFILAYFVILIAGFFASYLFIYLFFYEKYGASITYLPFLLAYNFFNSCYIFVSMLIYYSKSTKYLGMITIFTAFLHVMLLMFLVNQIGPMGAAISAMLISILTLVLVYLYSNKVYPMPWFKFKEIFYN